MRIGLARPVRFWRFGLEFPVLEPPGFVCGAKKGFPARNRDGGSRFIHPRRRFLDMLVERGLQLSNVEVVGEAYAIASNYLRKAGALPDNLATNERLLEIIVKMFQRDETNKIRLANKAIAQFEAETFVL
jgi:hypothetical protein